jgi:small subunit ribosomal protein S8
MTINDLIGDMITRIRNGYNVKSSIIIARYSEICKHILDILYDEGYIRGYRLSNKYTIEILLKYIDNKPVINQIIRISKPGCRIYYSINDLLNIMKIDSSIIYILSTSKGLMSSRKAIKLNIGGEVLCKVI